MTGERRVQQVGDLHVELLGSGDPVVLVHGNGESSRIMAGQAAALARRHLVVLPDTRSHGQSGRGGGPMTIDRLGDDLVDVIEATCGGGPADIVGYSDGANIAMACAIRHPRVVRSLVLISGNLDPSGLSVASRWMMRAVEVVLQGVAPLSRRVRARLETWRLMTRDPQIRPRDLGRVTAPTLVLVGEQDVIRPAHSRLIAASLPHGRLQVIPRAGHLLIRTHAAQVAAAIERFLAAAGADR